MNLQWLVPVVNVIVSFREFLFAVCVTRELLYRYRVIGAESRRVYTSSSYSLTSHSERRRGRNGGSSYSIMLH